MKIIKLFFSVFLIFFWLFVLSDSSEAQKESCNNTSSLKYYIENNCKARVEYVETPKMVNHLVFDGAQAICSAPAEIHQGYLNSVNANKVLDLSDATVPFLRNKDYQTKRLNSTENYYSYQASKYHNPEDDLLVQSGWIAKVLPLQVGCITKVTNLLYIYETCEMKKEISCDGLYNDATGEAKVANSDYTIKELVLEVKKEIKEEFNDDHIKDRVPFCTKLYTVEKDKTYLSENESAPLRKAIENFTYSLPTQYRTGYIVQAARICPVESPACCSKPIYEHDYRAPGDMRDECDWDYTPDQVRIFPFKYADVFSNKNFCNQYSESYPEECEFSDQYTQGKEVNSQIFQYANPLTEYYDSALLNKQYLEIISRHNLMREATQAARQEMADLANETAYKAASFVNTRSDDPINCVNCDTNTCHEENRICSISEMYDLHLKQALVKIINATSHNNVFFEGYLKENGSDIHCGEEVTMRNEITDQIEAPSDNVVENPLTDRIMYYDWCAVGCISPVYFAYARIKYWIVMPYGSEMDLIEKQILGSFYQTKDYEKFVEEDFRQNKRMLMNRVNTLDGETIPISMIGAGPITNIFIIQQSLYSEKEKLYLILANCENIEAYFLGKCGSGEARNPDDPDDPDNPDDSDDPVDPGDEDGIIAKICRAFGKYGEKVASEAVAIASAESGLNPNATNKNNRNGTWDYGLFQINGPPGKPPSDKLYDPDTNIANALGKYSRYGWCQWAVYKRPGDSWVGPCNTDSSRPWWSHYQKYKGVCAKYL